MVSSFKSSLRVIESFNLIEIVLHPLSIFKAFKLINGSASLSSMNVALVCPVSVLYFLEFSKM